MSTALDPRLIEREIARIREKESNPYSLGTKTNIFTLLVFRGDGAGEIGTADHVDAALQYLLGKRPARIITVHRSSSARTEAWVSGRCFPDKRNRGVCFEEVRIESGEDGVGEDPGAWAPLVIRDLPVFAWLPDGLAREAVEWAPVLKEAAGHIDKLVVDSSRASDTAADPVDAMRALQDLRDVADGSFIISDFSWRRSRVLREQTARAFDPVEMRPLLTSVRHVRLYGGSRAEAWQFFHWLSGRLGRGLQTEHAWEGPLSEGFRVTLTLDGAPAVDIGCTKGGCISRGDEKGAFRCPTDGEILLEEVDTLSRDPVFVEVLGHARRAGT